jgi:hypothetical protein
MVLPMLALFFAAGTFPGMHFFIPLCVSLSCSVALLSNKFVAAADTLNNLTSALLQLGYVRLDYINLSVFHALFAGFTAVLAFFGLPDLDLSTFSVTLSLCLCSSAVRSLTHCIAP